jgi:colanic acid/amylovoran biosynthesis glycosyltransferase
MNILYVQNSYPAASFVMNELYELDRRGHNVAVFANDKQEDIVHEEASELDIPVGHVSSLGISETLRSIPGFARRVTSGEVEFPFGVLRTHRAAKCIEFVESLDFEIDHIHVHFPVKGNIHAVDVAQELDVSLTTTAHAFEIFSDGLTGTTKEMCDSASRVLTISEYNRTYLRDVLNVASPIDVVPASIRLEKFSPGGTQTVPNRLLTVGRLVPKKGHIYAIDAVSTLVKEHPEIEYHIIGGGAEEQVLRRRVESRGIESNVEFLGKVSDRRLKREFSEAAVFVLPCVIDESGDRDGIPVVLMEAMAMQTPCISTYVSGIPELITDGETGLLVPERNANTLADAIESLFEHPERRESIGTSAQSFLESNHRISVEADKLIQSFDAATEGV